MLLLNYNQEHQIKMLLAYHNYSVSSYLKYNRNTQFSNRYDVEDWFDLLPEHLNFKSVSTIEHFKDTKDVHDLLMALVKYLGFKRKGKVTPERRAKLHEQILKLSTPLTTDKA